MIKTLKENHAAVSFLTVQQALSLLPEGETVHTFKGQGFFLGADWSRESAEKAIRESSMIVLAGPLMRSMGHGMAINAPNVTFVQTDKAAIDALDPVVTKATAQ